jgi:hypothetical protein
MTVLWIIGAGGALWLLFFPVTDLLTAGYVGGMNPNERFAAVSTLRGQIGTALSAALVGGGLYYTARKNSQDRDKQYTDRINDAIGNLGSSTETVRAGGIRSLRRILRDSPVDRQLVLDTVTGFLRSHTTPDDENDRDDVNAALDLLRDRGNPARRHGPDRLDLHGAHLEKTDLRGQRWTAADLSGTSFTGADLRHAVLTRALATEATLIKADLTDADLSGADLSSARLARATLTGTRLTSANLTDADLTGTDLSQSVGLAADQISAAKVDVQTKLPAALIESRS